MFGRTHSFSIIGYASLAASGGQTDLDLLRQWCMKVPTETEILAEEIHPNEKQRPMWLEILNQIKLGTVTTLVVPSLFHIAGDDVVSLFKVLTFLKTHDVTLKSLAELIDSRRDSKNDVIVKFFESSKQLATEGCAL